MKNNDDNMWCYTDFTTIKYNFLIIFFKVNEIKITLAFGSLYILVTWTWKKLILLKFSGSKISRNIEKNKKKPGNHSMPVSAFNFKRR